MSGWSGDQVTSDQLLSRGRSLHIRGWAESAHPGVGGAQQPRRPPSAQAQASQHYLEIMELECDWLEEVVAALSCEKPLWLDSRLVMEPLKSSEPITSV